MSLRRACPAFLAVPVVIALAGCAAPVPAASAGVDIDRDLLDVTIAQLHALYDAKTYTVTQVVQWHLARIDRYNGVYGAIETLFREEALAEAARQDAATGAARGPLWGVPIVVKANTSITGRVTTAGWAGFTRPGVELVAAEDATVVGKFRAAGAIVLGHTNMPDFANSDTNRSSSFGRTGNAYDVRFSPGGSSGGTSRPGSASRARCPSASTSGWSRGSPMAGLTPRR